MENRKSFLGANRKVVICFHRIMLICFLHSTFIAPSQNIINNYFNPIKPNYYISASSNSGVTQTPASKTIPINPLLLAKNYTRSKKINQISTDNIIFNNANLIVNADINEGTIGVTNTAPLDDVKDNLFKFYINNLPKTSHKAYLTYDLFGIQDYQGVSRSINDRPATGGYMVKKQTGWTKQREEINSEWLKRGENKLMFSIPEGAKYQYQIKNVQLEFDINSTSTSLVLNTPTIIYSKDNTIYIKGFLKNFNQNTQVSINETQLSVFDGEFEGFFKLTEETRKKKHVMLTASDSNGLLGQEIIQLENVLEADNIFGREENNKKISSFVTEKTTTIITNEQAVIRINDSALATAKEISVVKLRNIDIPPMSSGLVNVTAGQRAYRFLPDGTKFDNKVAISIGYDENLIPKGHTSNEIKTFYFNTTTKAWTPIERDTINKVDRTVTSYTDHFTDYINGIIQTPESPETAGFTPTMMNDIKAADPSSEMTIISPPEVSQKGEANVSYPIKIPAGRKGIQPQIAIQYSNEGANGWLGQGWNINIPSVSIDTRWGVPLLDPINESEIYMLNGEQLMYENILNENHQYVNWMPNRHYDAATASTDIFSTIQRPRISNAVFTPRKQGSFAKIERIGTNTTNYFWKVTNTDGTIYWYGGHHNDVVDNAVIKSAGHNANILHWGLYMVEDVFGNTMKYIYNNSTISGLSGVNSNLNGGNVFHIKSILYTGQGDANYGYQINFTEQSSFRQDIAINGRLGIKQVEPYFLENIIVKKFNGSANIRKYTFKLGYGKFKKGRLETVSELDRSNNIFQTHTFEYYDDLNQGGLDIYFSDGITQTVCNEIPPPCQDNDNDGVCNDSDECIDIPGPASNNGCPESQNCYEVGFILPMTNKLYRYSTSFINSTPGNCTFTPYRIKEFTFQGSTVSPSPPIYLSFYNPTTSMVEDFCNPNNGSFGTVYGYSTLNSNFNTQFGTWLNSNFFAAANIFDLNITSSSNFNCVGCFANPFSISRVTDRNIFVNFKSYDELTGNLKVEFSPNTGRAELLYQLPDRRWSGRHHR